MVPVMLDVLNLKQLITFASNLGCRSLHTSSLLILVKNRFVSSYMSNTRINYALHAKQATSNSVSYKQAFREAVLFPFFPVFSQRQTVPCGIWALRILLYSKGFKQSNQINRCEKLKSLQCHATK